ncbi:dihydrolipoamide acetyltransferase family protein [Streptomyces sp. NPDC001708]|uniref:dihydrolipoamide acetyltransferase family protein n=1 Tax=Streptomyces sp. NPDC001708 TaxID=3364602 RepID=UPI00369B207B
MVAGLRKLSGVAGRPLSRPAPPAPASRTFTLPDLGEGLSDAELLEWKVAVGDTVSHDQVVAEVETAKSVVALPSPFAGTVTALHCPAGEAVRVGAPLLSVAESEGGSGAVLTGYGTRAPERWATAHGHRVEDVEASEVRVPMEAAAEKYLRAHRETPAVTIWADVDATALLAERASSGVGLLALLARACLTGLAEFPEFNSRVDTDRQEVVRLPQVHLGFAAQTPKGLVVPVVRDADRLPLDALAAELRRLTDLARQDALTVGHRTGGTFTLNNYGVLDVDGATPILNHPQVAMLGVGRITDRPWAVDGRVEARKVVTLSLTFDHRVCDGGTAAGFLRHVVDAVGGGTAAEAGTAD